ncbi:YbaK/EbsC family protein [Knoellia subterranea]|uniref:Prolyl-tRNA synthetase n=1 Tax=Knoellia subterranea KCTC 19937 TaxID=1385521 RepID=A0A0A0JHS8_9MICO|nr:YbaK/EbsC family protein [Knoellia subterranea]KGN36970.1 prolyl-tRNA synthetase [Knoellia subterranea KCTC 19937]
MPSARGSLSWSPAAEHPELMAGVVAGALADGAVSSGVAAAEVATIDATLADTEAFCAAYDVALEASANCVIVAGKRGGEVTYAAVMILATDRADINGVVRRHLGVRKISFAPMDEAVSLTGMEYGGITPIGLPADWPVLVDAAVAAAGPVVIGSGVRASKVLVDGAALAELPTAEIVDLAQH